MRRTHDPLSRCTLRAVNNSGARQWAVLATVLAFVTLGGCGCAGSGPSSGQEQVVVQDPVAGAPARLLAAWNDGALDGLGDLVHPEVIRDDSGEPTRGLEAYLDSIRVLRGAFPDIQVSPIDSRRDGDTWIIRWRWSGTHKGPLLGMGPTGRRVKHSGRNVYTFRDGMLVHVQVDADPTLLLSQLKGPVGSASSGKKASSPPAQINDP